MMAEDEELAHELQTEEMQDALLRGDEPAAEAGDEIGTLAQPEGVTVLAPVVPPAVSPAGPGALAVAKVPLVPLYECITCPQDNTGLISFNSAEELRAHYELEEHQTQAVVFTKMYDAVLDEEMRMTIVDTCLFKPKALSAMERLKKLKGLPRPSLPTPPDPKTGLANGNDARARVGLLPLCELAGSARLAKKDAKGLDAEDELRGDVPSLFLPKKPAKLAASPASPATKLSLAEKRDLIQRTLEDVRSLSHSDSDGDTAVNVMGLDKWLAVGKRLSEVKTPAVCVLGPECMVKGQAADLPNEHTVKKHATGAKHQAAMNRQLDKAKRLAEEARLGASPYRSNFSAARFSPSGSNSGYRGGDDKRSPVPVFTSRTVEVVCMNLECKAKDKVKEALTKFACTRCHLLQAVRA